MRRFLLALFSHRLLAIARWDLHFLWLRVRNALTRSDRRAVNLLESRGHPVYMNLGAGPRGLDNQKWINVEGFKDRNVHILLDASRPLPFPDGSIDGVFCEHVLEHFSFEAGGKIAAEVR